MSLWIQDFIVFTEACHLVPVHESVEFISDPHILFFRVVLMLSCHIRLGLPRRLSFKFFCQYFVNISLKYYSISRFSFIKKEKRENT
jgi:hypothetical protein